METATATAAVAVARKRGVKTTIITLSTCIAALFVSAIVMSVQVAEDGAEGVYLWAMALLGAVIITLMLGAVYLAHVKETREHR